MASGPGVERVDLPPEIAAAAPAAPARKPKKR
jgi:hypothetical protein